MSLKQRNPRRPGALTPSVLLTAVLALALAAAVPAAAQEYASYGRESSGSTTAIGLRVGYTSWESIEQVHFGGHVQLGEVTENVDFTPNIEIGMGNDLTVVAVNGDLTYRFTELVAAPWGYYGGGSLALLYTDTDFGESDTDLGLSVVSGVTRQFDNGHEGRLEVRLGVLDYPGFKLTFGYTLF